MTTPQPAEPDAESTVAASPIVARLVQHCDSSEVWLEVSAEEGDAVRIAVTPASARRLVAVLHALLALPDA